MLGLYVCKFNNFTIIKIVKLHTMCFSQACFIDSKLKNLTERMWESNDIYYEIRTDFSFVKKKTELDVNTNLVKPC